MAKSNNELMTKIENAPSTKGPGDVIADYLKRMKDQIALALPKHMSADRLARIALTEIRTNPRLLQCSVDSLMAGVMSAARDGLEFGTGQCYLVPYWNEKKKNFDAQYQKGYQGLLTLIRRSGELQSIAAETVYENDLFEYEKGFNEKLRHVPNYENPGAPKLFYAYAILKDGGRGAVVMTKSQVDRIRERSKTKDNGPWVTDYEEMAKKTVLRRFSKLLPMAIEIKEWLKQEEEEEFGDKEDAIEVNIPDPVQIETKPPEPKPEPKKGKAAKTAPTDPQPSLVLTQGESLVGKLISQLGEAQLKNYVNKYGPAAANKIPAVELNSIRARLRDIHDQREQAVVDSQAQGWTPTPEELEAIEAEERAAQDAYAEISRN